MTGNQGVPCPNCDTPLHVALSVQVEARLTRHPSGGYGLGALQQTAAEVRRRLERENCDNGKLFVGLASEENPEGQVVLCPRCGFAGTATRSGIEGE
jgi:hypothetical protein